MFWLNPLEQFGFRGGAEASKTIIVRPYTRAYHRWTGERAKEREGGDRNESMEHGTVGKHISFFRMSSQIMFMFGRVICHKIMLQNCELPIYIP